MRLLTIILVVAALAAAGCSTSAQKGAGEGATLGAVGGAVAGAVGSLIFGGNVVQGAAQGAAIGAASGAATGAVAGSMADSAAKQRAEKAPAGDPPKLAELRKRIGDRNYATALLLAQSGDKALAASLYPKVAQQSGGSVDKVRTDALECVIKVQAARREHGLPACK
jgi:hypothetical protein